jgi:hypothetical protein
LNSTKLASISMALKDANNIAFPQRKRLRPDFIYLWRASSR